MCPPRDIRENSNLANITRSTVYNSNTYIYALVQAGYILWCELVKCRIHLDLEQTIIRAIHLSISSRYTDQWRLSRYIPSKHE